MTEDAKYAVLESKLDRLSSDLQSISSEVRQLEKNGTALNVTCEQLEVRMVSHKREHHTNYKDLQGEFKSLKDDLGVFKGDVLKRLDSMGGRDSVLKFLFGGGVVAIIVGLIKIFAGF